LHNLTKMTFVTTLPYSSTNTMQNAPVSGQNVRLSWCL